MKQFEITSFLESKFPSTLASQFDIGKGASIWFKRQTNS